MYLYFIYNYVNINIGDCKLSARKIGSLMAQKLGSLSAHKPGHSKRRTVIYIYIIYYLFKNESQVTEGYAKLREVMGGLRKVTGGYGISRI